MNFFAESLRTDDVVLVILFIRSDLVYVGTLETACISSSIGTPLAAIWSLKQCFIVLSKIGFRCEMAVGLILAKN
ncbi:hypothetical protein OUZ56_006353 [Daphnia magna]|uniref:Uncharacterized protein n=1 Tax=Daphnia magna TaxID=35525 RepID=A0ABQ9YVE1_9CRUS|nr:hypothetical protein OUZ56_006353 [Daphnia magna]